MQKYNLPIFRHNALKLLGVPGPLLGCYHPRVHHFAAFLNLSERLYFIGTYGINITD
jgi:hypothetical protein